MKQSVAKALPLVNQPYISIVTAVRLLSDSSLLREVFNAQFEEAARDADIRLSSNDIESWLHKAVGLVRISKDRIELSPAGYELAGMLGTSAFNCTLLRQLVDRGRDRFSYFVEANDQLELLRQRGEADISKGELNQLLNLVIANKTSGPIIRRLLIGLGVLHQTDRGYEIREICGDEDGIPLEARRLLDSAKQLVDAREWSWVGLLDQLRQAYGSDVVARYEEELRSHAVLGSTRSVEHVLDIRIGEDR